MDVHVRTGRFYYSRCLKISNSGWRGRMMRDRLKASVNIFHLAANSRLPSIDGMVCRHSISGGTSTIRSRCCGIPSFVYIPPGTVRTLFNLLATGSTLTRQHGEVTPLRGHDVHHRRTGEMGPGAPEPSGAAVGPAAQERANSLFQQWLIYPVVGPKRHGSETQRESKEAPLMPGHSCQRQWGHRV